MASDKILTNANDVTLIVSHLGGSATAGSTGRLVVDDFNVEKATDLSSHSGIGRHKPHKISMGDIEYSWDFTVEGEDRELFEGIAFENGVPAELTLIIIARDTKIRLDGAFVDLDSFSGSSGDATEMTFEGMATNMDRGAAGS